ncbi:MAG TPA: NAD-dependent deacylase [bacterium]|nr:NAD-dependent deacylase [bacterium]
MNDAQRQLAVKLAAAHKVVALSGAGLSAESGVPTFRGDGGLWRNRRPADLATPAAFAADPQLVWEFYNWRREKVLSVAPNPAHYALVEVERVVPAFCHITQNVDGLAHCAGGTNIIELHGNLLTTLCSVCREAQPHAPAIVPFPTYCDRCGALVRPGVVWFGENVTQFEPAVAMMNECDVLLVIGTSAVVQPAASLATIARRQGAFVAEFNLAETPLTDRLDLFIAGPAGRTLPPLVQAAFARRPQ